MKKGRIFFVMLFTFLFTSAFGQIDVQGKAKNKTIDRGDTRTDQGIDKTLDKVEEGIGSVFKKKSKTKNEDEDQDPDEITQNAPSKSAGDKETKSELASYSNYDFVPGDKLIYFYDMAGERDAEIPGRMRIDEGNAEIQTYNGEKILFIPAGERTYMNPAIKEKSYLPEQFTIEFDILSNGGIGTTIDNSEIALYMREPGETTGAYGSSTASIWISLAAVSGDKANYGLYSNDEDGLTKGSHQNFSKDAVNAKQDNWRHVAIYVNKNIAKLYVDQYRLGVLNQVIPGMASMLDIEINTPEHPVLLKNFRIAAGGADAYNKVITDGKFIAYGIQFDVNKATLKPESMGTINEFVKMMKENADLKFEIGGHTDSDGTADRNNILSQERAESVKKQMVSMGIDGSRLTTKGYGSLKPVTENNSAENKAKNRRVEFVKL